MTVNNVMKLEEMRFKTLKTPKCFHGFMNTGLVRMLLDQPIISIVPRVEIGSRGTQTAFFKGLE